MPGRQGFHPGNPDLESGVSTRRAPFIEGESMPIYEFRCAECGHQFSLLRPMSQSNAECACPRCQAPRRAAADLPLCCSRLLKWWGGVWARRLTASLARSELRDH